jgi:nitric oxide dioxygenase
VHGSQRRNYSISSVPGADHYRITVRRHETGVVSSWLHESVREGDVLQAANPAGDFFLAGTGSSAPVVFLTAGVGLTPIMSMLGQLAETSTGQGIRYIHGADSEAQAAFVPEITSLAAQNILTADFFYAKDAAAENTTVAGVTRHAGRIGTDWLRKTLDRSATYYICGPESFMHDMIAVLREESVPAARIRYEIFGSAADPALVI